MNRGEMGSIDDRCRLGKFLAASALAAFWAVLGAGCSNSPATQGQVVYAAGQDATPDGTPDNAYDFSDVPVADPGPAADVPPLPGAFGAPCETQNDCDSQICVDSAAGKVCSRACNGDCPTGFSCLQELVPGSSDTIYICVPKWKHLCEPCSANKDCNADGESKNICVLHGKTKNNLGSFCGASCNPMTNDCPGGYVCETQTDQASGSATNQCVPANGGECTCSASSVGLSLETTCATQNSYGSCLGKRTCLISGLSMCSAVAAAPEECDGIDNDCNGFTDDFDTNSATCSLPLNEFNVVGMPCKGKLVACVNGKPDCQGAPATPEICNQLDDNCDGITDNVKECDDLDPCTNDTCDAAGCQHKPLNGTPCNDSNVCTQQSKCLSGICTGGDQLNCDDKDPCTTDSCDPFTGCVHTPASDAVCPDDGNQCTQDLCKDGTCSHIQVSDGAACVDDGQACTADVCMNGICKHNPADGVPCADDGNACTDDVCQAGGCVHKNNSGPCEDGNACTEGDVCANGNCLKGTDKQCNDGNDCTKDSCNPNVSGGCVYDSSSVNGGPCTKGGECPTGHCSAGSCLSVPNVTCKTSVKVDLCGSVDVAGVCTSNGSCVATSAPQGYACPGCKSVCIKCYSIPVCLDFIFSTP